MPGLQIDRDARQKAVKVTITGVELDAMETTFHEASADVKRSTEATEDGKGDLCDLARLAGSYGVAEATAAALYQITGSATWRSRAETARRGRTSTVLACASRERAVARKIVELGGQALASVAAVAAAASTEPDAEATA